LYIPKTAVLLQQQPGNNRCVAISMTASARHLLILP